MPWDAKSFSTKHNKKLSGKAADTAARMATAMVKAGVPEGEAVATANKKGDKMMRRDGGGPVSLNYTPPTTGEWGRKYTTDLSNLGERLERDEANPSVEGSIGRGEGNNMQVTYRKSIPFASGGSVRDGGSLADHAYKLAGKMAREQEKAAAPHFDLGGTPEIPAFERAGMRDLEYQNDHPMKGFINSAGPGRTDTHAMTVGSGAYVLPADVISGYGEGNSAFGANVIQKMLSVGPYGTPVAPTKGGGRGVGIPRPPAPFSEQQAERQGDIGSVWPPHFDKGGLARDGDEGEDGKPVPVALAGGEFCVPHSWWTDGKEILKGVKQIGGGSLSRGHHILDKFVIAARKKSVKDTANLPPPKKSDEK